VLRETTGLEGHVVVLRQPPGDLREYRCATLPLGCLQDLDAIAREYGGGSYRLLVKAPKGNSPRPVIRYVLKANFDPRIRGVLDQPYSAIPARTTMPAPPESSGGLAAELAQIRQLLTQVLTREAPAAASAAGTPPDQTELLKFVWEMLRETRTKGPIPELFEALKLGIQLGETGGREEPERGSPLMGMLEGLLTRVLTAPAPPLPAPPALAMPTPGGNGQPPAPPAPGPEPAPPVVTRRGLIGVIERQLPELMDRARRGRDPGVSADYLAELIEDDPEALAGLVPVAPILYSELLAAHPEVQPFSGWWRDFFHELRAGFSEPPQDGEADASADDAPGDPGR